MARPRVLQAMAGSRHGGAEAFFTRLVIALHRAGLEQRVVIRRDPARAARLRAAGIEPIELRFGNALDICTRVRLGQEIRRWRPDIVLSWMNRATALVPPHFFAGPYVHVARLGGYYDLKYYRQCDHLIGNTRDIVAYIERSGWPKDRAHFVPNFVDDAPAEPIDRRALATPIDAAVVLAMGRLHPNKAFDVAIDAVALMPGVWLWLAGEGEERASLEAQAAKLGVSERVKFLGWREDVGALLAGADLLVCPSRHEPLGNVVIEAWARSCPVVAAASQGPKALIEDGRTGILVPIDDAAALAAAVKKVIGDAALAARLASEGRASYESAFTEAAVVRHYLDLFSRMIE